MDTKILNVEKLILKVNSFSKINLRLPIERGTRLIQNDAKRMAPRDYSRPPKNISAKVTGNLRNSIHVDYNNEKMQGRVYTSLEYAQYQEFGTRNMIPRPFMLPAFNLNLNTIRNDIKSYIRGEVNKK